ncbi:ATP-binding protein [Nonomuraea sp. NPDC003754]
MAAKNSARNIASELAYLTRALKAPSLAASIERLAERARAEDWSHEEFLAACLQREVAAREAHGGAGRIRLARFPARKSLEEFDYDHQRSLKRDTITHLGTLDFVTARENVVFLGPPGTGKTHLSIGLGIRACQAGHRVLLATAAEWVGRLADAHHTGRLQEELIRLGRIPLLISSDRHSAAASSSVTVTNAATVSTAAANFSRGTTSSIAFHTSTSDTRRSVVASGASISTSIAEAIVRAAEGSFGKVRSCSVLPARSARASRFAEISRSSTSSASSTDAVSRCRTVASNIAALRCSASSASAGALAALP